MSSILKRVGQICGCRKKPRPETRKIYVGNQAPDGVDVTVPVKYPSNRIVSSKYTAWNFIFLNLFEQFRRIANFYFLCVGLVELLVDTPVSPITSFLPLVGVITATAVKQGYEDWLRHVADKEVNDRVSYVVKDNMEHKIKAMQIHVGDIVRVDVNEAIPCDLVMLSSEDPEGSCYITTANLDGETNLKTFCSIFETKHLQQPQHLKELKATIECEQPTTDLYSFVGNLTVHGENSNHITKPLGPENVLLRGSRLRNTSYVYGCAIYTGPDTKISLNSKYSLVKYSQVEIFMNKALIVFLVILGLEASILTGLKYWSEQLPNNLHSTRWYVPEMDPWTFKRVVEEFLSFMVLCNYIIPISLYVTIEMQKFIGSMFFEWDQELYDAQNNEAAKANTSDLNEELGQVEMLFTDKTGTLTENDMQFRQCSSGGTKYIEVGGLLCLLPDIPDVQPTPIRSLTPTLEALLTVLALCHTVRVDVMDNEIKDDDYNHDGFKYEYQASSPDEKALVEAARRYGVVYHGVKDDHMLVTFKGQLRRFYQHHLLDFDPTRKRMSILVEDENGEKYLMTKGAETAIMDRCSEGDVEEMEYHVNDYAMLGLRTLVIAQRHLSEEEFIRLDDLLKTARQSLDNREKCLAEAFSETERELTLLGATAVEDRLQDGVPDTISSLRKAGIQVWVLTGDKEETAVNISYSAGHFYQDVRELRLTQQRNSENCGIVINQLTHILRDALSKDDRDHALIIDGQSLVYGMADHREALQELCEIADTVLCCRMTPIQKAQVVKLMKTSKAKPITAAIGDGANDVSMIQEAHVGLGVMGKEGRQAVRSSDYAFGRFRFLKRVLLVHGHFFYVRLANLVQYFFYKNVAFIVAQFYYVFFNAYSAQSLYDTIWLTFYNVFFTSCPVLIYGLFEQNIQPKELLEQPELYRMNRRNARLTWGQFLKWCMLGLWHSLVVFFGTYTLFHTVTFISPDGVKLDGVNEFGSILFTVSCFIVNIKLLLEWYYISVATAIAYGLTLLAYYVLSFGYSCFKWSPLVSDYAMYGVIVQIFSNIVIWLLWLLLGTTALLPDLILRAFRDSLTPVYRNRAAKKARRRRRQEVELLRMTPTCLRGGSTSSDMSLISSNDSFTYMDSPVFSVHTSNSFFPNGLTPVSNGLTPVSRQSHSNKPASPIGRHSPISNPILQSQSNAKRPTSLSLKSTKTQPTPLWSISEHLNEV